MKSLLSVLFSLLLASSLAFAGEKSASDYPLEVCVVSGEDLGSMGDPIIYWHKIAGQPDREVRLCCERCEGRFNSNPEKYLAEIDAAMVSAEACCAESVCCEDATCESCTADAGNKPCCDDGKCESCAKA